MSTFQCTFLLFIQTIATPSRLVCETEYEEVCYENDESYEEICNISYEQQCYITGDRQECKQVPKKECRQVVKDSCQIVPIHVCKDQDEETFYCYPNRKD